MLDLADKCRFDLVKKRRDTFPFGYRNSADEFQVPGLGRVYLQGVGNTSYSTAIDVSFWAYREKRPRRGILRYSPVIREDGEIEWAYRTNTLYGLGDETEENQTRFPKAVIPAIHLLLANYDKSHATSWVFLIESAARKEARKLEYDRASILRGIEVVEDCLEKKHLIEDEAARAEKVEWWTRRIAFYKRRLADWESDRPRFEMLLRIKRVLDRWCHRGLDPERYNFPIQLVRQAVHEKGLRERAPMVKMWD